MPTMVSFTAGTPILSADVNANFTALTPAMVCLYSDYSVASAVGTAATVLKTFSMPANTLTATGSGLRVSAQGYCSADAYTKTYTFYCGTAFASLNPTTAAPNNKYFSIDLYVVRTSATECAIHGITVLSAYSTGASPTLEAAGNFTSGTFQVCGAFTSPMTVRIYGQMGNAAAQLTLSAMSVWAFNAP
jgi:hypothetical protein